MTTASNSDLWRKGETQDDWYVESSEIEISRQGDKITLDLKIPSKGGGTTCLKILIGKEDFPAVLDQMVYADRLGTLQICAKEIQLGLEIQPSLDDMVNLRHDREVGRLKAVIQTLQQRSAESAA